MDTIRIKRGPKSRLPQHASVGEPLYCTDTNELYIGQGNDKSLSKLMTLNNSTTDDITQGKTNLYITPEEQLKLSTHKYYNLEMFKTPEDDSSDNTDLFQRLFDSITEGSIVDIPSGSYSISRPLFVRSSNTTINFNGSELKWVGVSDLGNYNGTNRVYGSINMWGKSVGDEVPITRYEVFSRQEGSSTKIYSSINVSVGDYVSIYMASMPNLSWSKDMTDEPTYLKQIFKVMFVGSGYFEIPYVSPFNFNSSTFSGTVQLVKPINNLVVNDLKFYDSTEGLSEVEGDLSVRNSWVCGLSLDKCVNITLNNYSCSRHKFPGVMLRYSDSVFINNFYGEYPRSVGAGCGYGIQSNNSQNVIIRDSSGFLLRHLVDFSCSIMSKAINCVDKGLSSRASFDCHGICEHDIVFDKCIGTLNVGNGIEDFPMVTENLYLIDCDMPIVSLHSCKTLYARDCNRLGLGMTRGSRYLNKATITNSKILCNSVRGYFYGLKRRPDYELDLHFVNCDIINVNDTLTMKSDVINFVDYEVIRFNNCRFLHCNTDLEYSYLEVSSKEVIYSSCQFSNMYIINNYTNKEVLKLENCDIRFAGTHEGLVYMLNINSTGLGSTQVCEFSLTGSKVIGTDSCRIGWIRSTQKEPLSNTIIMISGNIFKNVGENAISTLFNNCDKLIDGNLKVNYSGQLLN